MSKVLIIAEAGVNHNGELSRALELVDRAADCGADIVKFQTFKADKLVAKSAPKAAYQVASTGSDQSQYEMLKALELGEAEFEVISRRCETRGVEFMSTPFDEESLAFLVDKLAMKRLKVGSGDVTNAPYLLAAAKTELPVIVSTGMCTLAEIECALGVLAFGYTNASGKAPGVGTFEAAYSSVEGRKLIEKNVTILHCTSEYPAPDDDINLAVMKTLRLAFGLPTGFSDHSRGIAIPIGAVALGATVIEKHFTLDKTLPGPDHRASIDIKELRALVDGIRQVERAIGSGIKRPAPSELSTRSVARRSLVASKLIAKGEKFTVENTSVRRPGTGIGPIHFWSVLGTSASRDYLEGQLLVEPIGLENG